MVKSNQNLDTSLGDALQCIALDHIHLQTLLNVWKTSLKSLGTAYCEALWLQYQDMISVLKSHIRSACIGNWSLYLQTLCDMHPYLAAAGYNNYTKSLAVFIPKMIDLQRTHPDVHSAFSNGLFPS